MRRKPRQITEMSKITEILKKRQVMNLVLADSNIPFTVPVFYVYDGTAIYVHSALADTKIEMMKKKSRMFQRLP
ncbi:MAG: pyridoxamine 5'-phosphate oxidase family protein [Deferribacterales bacterium]